MKAYQKNFSNMVERVKKIRHYYYLMNKEIEIPTGYRKFKRVGKKQVRQEENKMIREELFKVNC